MSLAFFTLRGSNPEVFRSAKADINQVYGPLVDALAAKGYEIIRSPASFGIALVHGIRVQGELLDGGADPGADGMALRV